MNPPAEKNATGCSGFRGQGVQHSGNGSLSAETNSRSREGLLSKLRTADPKHDKQRIEAQHGGLFAQAYQWIVDHAAFSQWRDRKENRFLWIQGDPGKGKTMLLCGVINELEREQVTKAQQPVAYFFCQATDARLNNVIAVVSGLIYHLLKENEKIQNKLNKQFMDLLEEDKPIRFFVLKEILLSILKEPEMQDIYLIIDALDECESGQAELLDLIIELSSLQAKVLVSSRNWPNIEGEINRARCKTALILELNPDSISAAVKLYIDHQVRRLAVGKNCDEATQKLIRHHLLTHSNDTFLWVALVCRRLMSTEVPRHQIRQELAGFPPGLNAVYDRMARQTFKRDKNDRYKQTIALLLLATQPMSLKQLEEYVEIFEEFPVDDHTFRDIVVELCGSFLTMKNGVVYYIHQSAKDYVSKHISEKVQVRRTR